jgi:cyclic pyranopterin phosphate synthase
VPVNDFSHLDEQGRARMVDISEKPITSRLARASATISMNSVTFAKVMSKDIRKGDVFQVARIAGIMAAKQTSSLIPLTHPLRLSSVEVAFIPEESHGRIRIETTVRCDDKTGVEMEALTACAVAALTIYDMCKALDKGMVISNLALLEKHGGKSGDYVRPDLEGEHAANN